jgi:hypothetical protein
MQAAENVLGLDCPSTRDTSVQIFDKLMMHSFGDDANILQNDRFVSYSAVASLVLGAKIIDQHTELTMVRRPHTFLHFWPNILTPPPIRCRTSSRTSTWTT